MKITARKMTTPKTAKPFERRWKGRISTVYEIIRGVNAISRPAKKRNTKTTKA